MCEPAYSEPKLQTLFILQELDTVKEGILLELVLNVYICHLGQLEEKICPRNGISNFKDLNMVTTVTDHWSNKICRRWDGF